MIAEEAMRCFCYCQETGDLFWRIKPKHRPISVGDKAGTDSVKGYRVVTLRGRKHYAHRIIWLMNCGPIQSGMCIDHIDGNGLNNRLENLRLVTLSQNQRNSRIPVTNKTGVMCIYRHPKGHYGVTVAGQYIGIYQDMQSAIKARDEAFKRMGCHPNHGRNPTWAK